MAPEKVPLITLMETQKLTLTDLSSVQEQQQKSAIDYSVICPQILLLIALSSI